MLHFFIVLMVCLTATAANARASGMAQGRLSTLSYERLQRLPPVIHKTFKSGATCVHGRRNKCLNGVPAILERVEGRRVCRNTLRPVRVSQSGCSLFAEGLSSSASSSPEEACIARFGEEMYSKSICRSTQVCRQ